MTKKINLNLPWSERIPTPKEIYNEIPLNSSLQTYIIRARESIKEALHPSSNKILLIIGPCSIHNIEAAKEYAIRLKNLAEKTSESFVIAMRVYYEKPRTSVGWKGLVSDPNLDGSFDIVKGFKITRQLLADLATLGIPAACEFLDPLTYTYFKDLIAWGCIGARTSESQIHRQIASNLDMPMAIKNSTAGSIEVAINGILAAKNPHVFLDLGMDGHISKVKSPGNPHCHIVLRGGESGSNYDPASISTALKALKNNNLTPRILVDCSHDNSKRNCDEQPRVFQSVFHQIFEGEKGIRGLILESYLEAGNQPMALDSANLKPSISLTDPCIDWDTTEKLVLWAHERYSKEKKLAMKTGLTHHLHE